MVGRPGLFCGGFWNALLHLRIASIGRLSDLAGFVAGVHAVNRTADEVVARAAQGPLG